MKKKLIYGLIAFATLIILDLFLTSKISDAYTTASRRILVDPTIAEKYGAQQYAVLVGSQYKLGPERSCARLRFVLKGARSSGFVEVLLQRKKIYRDPWVVREVVSGYYNQSQVGCSSV